MAQKEKFNILVLGQRGLGKTTCVNALLAGHRAVPMEGCEESCEQMVKNVCRYMVDFQTGGFCVSIYEFDGYGRNLDNRPIFDVLRRELLSGHHKWRYIDSQILSEEERLQTDNRIHCVLYFMSPNSVEELDFEMFRVLNDIAPIIPIVAKVDTLTASELSVHLEEVEALLRSVGPSAYYHSTDTPTDEEGGREQDPTRKVVPNLQLSSSIFTLAKYENDESVCSMKKSPEKDNVSSTEKETPASVEISRRSVSSVGQYLFESAVHLAEGVQSSEPIMRCDNSPSSDELGPGSAPCVGPGPAATDERVCISASASAKDPTHRYTSALQEGLYWPSEDTLHPEPVPVDAPAQYLLRSIPQSEPLPLLGPRNLNVFAMIASFPGRFREHSYGKIDILDKSLSDFRRLQLLLFSSGTHIHKLKRSTQAKTIALFKSQPSIAADAIDMFSPGILTWMTTLACLHVILQLVNYMVHQAGIRATPCMYDRMYDIFNTEGIIRCVDETVVQVAAISAWVISVGVMLLVAVCLIESVHKMTFSGIPATAAATSATAKHQ